MKIRIITIFFVSLLFTQCNKKEHECITLEPIPRVYTNGHELEAVFPYPFYPYFNPNNSDEIIFVNYTEEFTGFNRDTVHELVKFNLKTKESEVVVRKYFGSKARWGKNDWIVFDSHDDDGFNVFKVKSNGEGLTNISKNLGVRCFDPQWDYKEENLMFSLYYHEGRYMYHPYVLTDPIDHHIIDTLESGGNEASSWSHPKYMVSTELKGLVLSNPYDKEEEEYLYEYEKQGQGVDWLDEERVIWCHESGVYVTNIITKETKMIKETCNADFLRMPTYAPDINRVIFQRQQHERFREDRYEGIVTKSLYMMKPNGKKGETLEVY